MCWSATTSFVTLGVGTLLNVVSYTLLRHWNSPAALLVWWWQYGLLMQIPEGIVWLQLDDGQKDIRAASRVALALHLTQPVALLLSIRVGDLYCEFRYSYAVLFMYAVALATNADEMWARSASIAPEEDCAHLSLRYWDVPLGTTYVVTSLLVVSEARPVFWALVNAGALLVTITLAIALYPCGVGSLWCWFIFAVGPLLVLSDRAWDARHRLHSVTLPEVQHSDVRGATVRNSRWNLPRGHQDVKLSNPRVAKNRS